MCFFCIVIEEDSMLRYLTYLVAKAIWIVISQLWVSLTGFLLPPFLWGFAQKARALHSALGIWDL